MTRSSRESGSQKNRQHGNWGCSSLQSERVVTELLSWVHSKIISNNSSNQKVFLRFVKRFLILTVENLLKNEVFTPKNCKNLNVKCLAGKKFSGEEWQFLPVVTHLNNGHGDIPNKDYQLQLQCMTEATMIRDELGFDIVRCTLFISTNARI